MEQRRNTYRIFFKTFSCPISLDFHQTPSVFYYSTIVQFVQSMFLISSSIIIVSTLLITTLSVCSRRNSVEDGHLARIYKSFAPLSNFYSIYSSKPPRFPEINGLRLASSLFILAFHIQYFSLYKLTSRYNAFLLAEEFLISLITNGPIFVEVFFVIR